MGERNGILTDVGVGIIVGFTDGNTLGIIQDFVDRFYLMKISQ